MNKRLTNIARALRAVETAMLHVRFSHNPLMSALKSAYRWLRVAKRHALNGQIELSDITLGNAETHLRFVLGQLDRALVS